MPNLESLMHDWLGAEASGPPLTLGQAACRAVAVYMGGLALIRLGKSRFLARASAMDVLVAVMLGAILARGIVKSTPLSVAFVACAVVIALHWLGTWCACRSHQVGNWIKGHARLLVKNGKIDWTGMRKSHLSIHDLEEAMRLRANIDDLDRVKAAYKERSGDISIVVGTDSAADGPAEKRKPRNDNHLCG